MLDIGVAIEALDFVSCDMVKMDVLWISDSLQLFRISMALKARPALHLSGTAHRIQVATLAFDTVLDHMLMVEDSFIDCNRLGRIAVALQAETLRLWSFHTHLALKVAQVARYFRDCHVAALNNLAVAGSTAQLDAAYRFTQMVRVVKLDVLLEDYRPRQKPRVVAPAAQTRRIVDLRMELRIELSGKVRNHLVKCRELCFKLPARTVVALNAAYIAVAGLLPRFDVGVHYVAGITETWRLGVFGYAPSAKN